MLTHLDPTSALAAGLLSFALIRVVIFAATNGFHDAANGQRPAQHHQAEAAGVDWPAGHRLLADPRF
jgi:hypothetical protein